MKQRSWTTIAEYLMLVGSGVGSVATAASQQFLYTAAPLSMLMLLNLANHRRLEKAAQETTETSVAQLDQKLSATIRLLQQQIQALPSAMHLANLRQDLQLKNQQTVEEMSGVIEQIQQDLGDPNWRLLPQAVAQLQEQYAIVADSVAGVQESLRRLGHGYPETDGESLEHLKSEVSQLRQSLQTLHSEQRLNQYRILQDQINHLNRRLNNMPAPGGTSNLKQDVESLIKKMGEMSSRRDLAKLEAQFERLSLQNVALEQSVAPMKMAANILKKQMEAISNKVNSLGANPSESALETVLNSEVIQSLQQTVAVLEERLEQVPASTVAVDLREEIEQIIASQVEPLQHQLEEIQEQTQTLDREQKTLREWVHHLPQLLDTTALQSEVKYLATRVEWAENSVVDVQMQLEAQGSPDYELVFDIQTNPFAHGNRTVLETALENTDARLVAVFPMPTPETLDDRMIHQFRQFLDRRGCLDLGLGRLEETSLMDLPLSIDRRRALQTSESTFLPWLLNQLSELKRQYPDHFRFKVLGTEEQFVVCDRAYAILGTPALTTASMQFPRTATGLKTTNPEVIQRLVARFDNPTLEAADATTYFNRAASRYHLGDRAGAIADYTEVIAIQPSDVAYNNRALAAYELGHRDTAIADLDEAIQYNPHNFIAFCNRGFIRSEEGDKLGAIEDYTYALQLNPDYSVAYFYRGLARTRMQNRLGAIQDYTDVIRLNSQDASAYFYRGLAGAKLGQRMEAIRDLRQAAQLFSQQGDAANYRQTVTAIKKLHKMMVIGGAGKGAAVSQVERAVVPQVERANG